MKNMHLYKNLTAVLLICLSAGIFSGASCNKTALSETRFSDALEIISNEFKLYSQPDTKAKVLESSFESTLLYVDPAVIKNESGSWYKVVYCWLYGDWLLRQVNKLPEFNKSFVYVNFEDIKTKPAEDYVKDQIDWLRAGRPPRHKVGDSINPSSERNEIKSSIIIEFKTPATLFNEPKEGASTITVPKGFKCLGPLIATEDSFPAVYANMEEENWSLIIDIETKKVVGWIESEKLNKISKWIEPK